MCFCINMRKWQNSVKWSKETHEIVESNFDFHIFDVTFASEIKKQ